MKIKLWKISFGAPKKWKKRCSTICLFVICTHVPPEKFNGNSWKSRKQFVIFFCCFWENWNFLEILASSVLNSHSNLSFSRTDDSKKIPWSLEFERFFDWEQVWNFAKETKEFVGFCLERNPGTLKIFGFLQSFKLSPI
jgi:hypothetical protein